MAGQLKEVRNRIKSTQSTQQITKAMKMVSAAKLRKAQDAVTQMRPYAQKLQEMLSNIVSNSSSDSELKLAIEYDGEQHFKLKNNSFGAGEEKSKINFEKLVQNDKIKNEYCVNNNILLIRIRYDENILNVENKIKEQVYGRN